MKYTNDDLLVRIKQLRKPLFIVMADNYDKLHTIKKLDYTIILMIDKILENKTGFSKSYEESLLNIKSFFSTFLNVSFEEKQRVIKKSYELLTNLENSIKHSLSKPANKNELENKKAKQLNAVSGASKPIEATNNKSEPSDKKNSNAKVSNRNESVTIPSKEVTQKKTDSSNKHIDSENKNKHKETVLALNILQLGSTGDNIRNNHHLLKYYQESCFAERSEYDLNWGRPRQENQITEYYLKNLITPAKVDSNYYDNASHEFQKKIYSPSLTIESSEQQNSTLTNSTLVESSPDKAVIYNENDTNRTVAIKDLDNNQTTYDDLTIDEFMVEVADLSSSGNNTVSIANFAKTVDNVISNINKLPHNNHEETIKNSESTKEQYHQNFDASKLWNRRKKRKRIGIKNVLDTNTTFPIVQDFSEKKKIDKTILQILVSKLSDLPAIGPKLGAILEQHGIKTVYDIIHFLPKNYHDRRNIQKISSLIENSSVIIIGTVLESEIVTEGKFRHLIVKLADDTGFIYAKWHNIRANYLKNRFRIGVQLIAWGAVSNHDNCLILSNPETEIVEDNDDELNFNKIVPLYSTIEGVGQKTLRRIIFKTLEYIDSYLVSDFIPHNIKHRNHLLEFRYSIRGVHFPENVSIDDLNNKSTDFHRSIAFRELFFLQFALACRRKVLANESGLSIKIKHNALAKIIKKMPMNESQLLIWETIKRDLNSSHPMFRLFQCDNFTDCYQILSLSIMMAYSSDFQVAVITQTETISAQYYSLLKKNFFNELEIDLYSPTVKGRIREKLLHRIRKGEVKIIVGTSSILQDSIGFKKLGLVVLDEQYRSALVSRNAILKKGLNPNIIVLTAQPLPNAIVKTIYGEITHSIFPKQPCIKNRVITQIISMENRLRYEQYIRDELASGQQMIYLMSSKDDRKTDSTILDVVERLKKYVFPDVQVSALFTKMAFEEYTSIVDNFFQGKVQLLVVQDEIPVTVLTPKVSLMIIEESNTYSLSQIHGFRQLLSTSNKDAHCFLVPKADSSIQSVDHLKNLESMSNGFEVAEKDFEFLGPDAYLGVRQSGLSSFFSTTLLSHVKEIDSARKEAFRWVDGSLESMDEDNNKLLKEFVKHRWSGLVENIL